MTPEPEPEERDPLLATLERLLAEPRAPVAYRSAWRRAGLDEALAEEPSDQAIPPRRSRGAERT